MKIVLWLVIVLGNGQEAPMELGVMHNELACQIVAETMSENYRPLQEWDFVFECREVQ